MTAKLPIGDQDVLLVVDIQNDFCPEGRFAVPRGDEIVSVVNRLATRFKHVVLTQDWHPSGHLSFASAHPHADLILRKGYHRDIDSYSAFYENDRRTRTGLAGYLRERRFTRVFLAGLAFDFCVRYSSEDAKHEGFEVVVFEDACRAIDVDGSMLATRKSFNAIGIRCVCCDAVG
jgi:nicotinamidase/pyrazinamidase